MRLKKFSKIAIVGILLLFSFLLFNTGDYNEQCQVFAIEETPSGDGIVEETPEQEEVNAIYEKGYIVSLGAEISDANLYSELLKIVKNHSREEYGIAYSGDSLYSEMFEFVTEIDIQNKNITTLSGFEHLRLTNLTSLNLAGNSLSVVTDEIFTYTSKLISINFANNKLTSFDLTSLNKLRYVNLSSNQLSTIDLTNIVTTNVQINLANNYFTSISDIKIPTRVSSIQLNIIANDITDITDDYFNLSKLTMNVGVQGIKGERDQDFTMNTSSEIKFYKTNIENCVIKVYRIDELEDVLVDTIKDTDITGNYITKKYGIGNYYYVYTLNGEDAYNKLDHDRAYFTSEKFNVIPSDPKYMFEYKGEQYENIGKVTGSIKVLLSSEDDATIYYSVNGGGWVEGSEVVCRDGGNYTIRMKSVVNGVESNQVTVLVKTSLNSVIPDALMLVLVLAFAIVLFVVVVPLVGKKFFRK